MTPRVKYVSKYKGNRRVTHWMGSNWPSGNRRVKWQHSVGFQRATFFMVMFRRRMLASINTVGRWIDGGGVDCGARETNTSIRNRRTKVLCISWRECYSPWCTNGPARRAGPSHPPTAHAGNEWRVSSRARREARDWTELHFVSLPPEGTFETGWHLMNTKWHPAFSAWHTSHILELISGG